jgi:hypothetical protein
MEGETFTINPVDLDAVAADAAAHRTTVTFKRDGALYYAEGEDLERLREVVRIPHRHRHVRRYFMGLGEFDNASFLLGKRGYAVAVEGEEGGNQ